MKIRTNSYPFCWRRFFCVLLLVVVSACARVDDAPTATPSREVSAIVTTATKSPTPRSSSINGDSMTPGMQVEHPRRTPTIEQADQARATQTPVLSRTSTPSADGTLYGGDLHSATATQWPTMELQATAIPVSTLTDNEESDLLSSLMLSNGGCELPCWWGITPGITTEQEAAELITSLGLDWDLSGDFRIIHLGYPREPTNLASVTGITTRLWIESGIVKLIEIEGGYRPEGFRQRFEEEWRAFSPGEIVARFGPPELVEFDEVENSPFYRLVLAYDSSGIQVTYILPFTVTGEGRRQICFGLDSIDHLYPAFYQARQSDKLPYELLASRQETYVSWQEMTGQALDDFTATALNSGCVELSP